MSALKPESSEDSDGRSVRAKELREERREQILKAARKLFAERGYHATSITDVIEAAGIARGTFYLYFGSKRAIFAEVIDDLFLRLSKSLRPIETGPGAPPVMDQLNDILERVITILLNEPEVSQLLSRTGLGIDADFDQKLDEFYGAVTDLVRRVLVQGKARGVLREHNHELIAEFVVGGLQRAIYELHRDGQKMTIHDFVAEFVRYNFEGILKR